MNLISRLPFRIASVLSVLCLVNPVQADTLIDTGTPDFGFIGYYGFDVYVQQSVAIAFTPSQNYSFDDASLWLMSNDYNAAGRTLTVSLQTDSGGGPSPLAPSGTSLESWSVATSAVGGNPALETVNSILHPILNAGTTYWIVAVSSEPGLVNPVWVATNAGASYTMANLTYQTSSDWQVSLTGGPPGVIVDATLAPVPEPSTWALALLGIPFLLWTAKRKAKVVARD